MGLVVSPILTRLTIDMESNSDEFAQKVLAPAPRPNPSGAPPEMVRELSGAKD